MLRLRLAFSSRGLVAKNAPPGHFLDAPTDGAPEKAATNVAAFLLHHSLWDGLVIRLRFVRGLIKAGGSAECKKTHQKL